MRSYNIKRWKKKTIRLNQLNQILYAERDNTIKEYDLGNYLYRLSKNNEYYSFVLEAINNKAHEKAKTVHIGFEDVDTLVKWSDAIQICIDYKHWQRIYIEMVKAPPPRLTFTSIRSSQMSESKNVELASVPQKSSPKKEELPRENKEKNIMETNETMPTKTNQLEAPSAKK